MTLSPKTEAIRTLKIGVTHGKRVPVLFDETGQIKIPFIKTDVVKWQAWDDRTSLWPDVMGMPTDHVSVICRKLFEGILGIANSEYANFYALILQELKSIPTQLQFEYYGPGQDAIFGQPVSFTASSGVTNVSSIYLDQKSIDEMKNGE